MAMLTLFDVGNGLVDGALGNAQSLGSDADTAAVQRSHGQLEALALDAEQTILRDDAVFHDQLAGGGTTDAHLVLGLADLEAGIGALYDEGADLLLLAAALVGGQAADQDEPSEEEHRDHLHAQILLLREAQRGHAVGQRPGAQHVKQRVGDAHRAGAEHKTAPMMDQVAQRGLRRAVLSGGLLEDGSLAHAHAHDQADDHGDLARSGNAADHKLTGLVLAVGVAGEAEVVRESRADDHTEHGHGAVAVALRR